VGTIFDAFLRLARGHSANACIAVPSRPGRSYHPAGLRLTYGETLVEVATLQATYHDRGYGLGHRIGLLLDSQPDMILHMLALNGLGASIVPLNPDLRRDELRYVLRHSEVDLVVTLAHRGEQLAAACETLDAAPAIASLVDIRQALPRPRKPIRRGRRQATTEAAILYTSGTTAAPKGCIITNEYGLYAGERYLSAPGILKLEHGRERLYNPLPLFYVNSLFITTMTMFLSAGCSIYPDRFHAKTFWAEIAETQPTIIQYLGIVLPALLALPKTPEEASHRVRLAVGAGLDPALHPRLEERFRFPVVEVWGMTEVAIASMAGEEPRRIETRSIGRPLRGMEFRIVDDADRALPPGTAGELVLRREGQEPRRGLVAEYLKDHESTEAAWRAGWFHSGDLMVEEPDGTFRFIDRKKDIIRRSGQNIASSEVETALLQHDAVAQAACLPVPDELREEEVLACIVLRDPAAASRETAEALCRHTLARLAYFKAPGWLVFMDALPLTATQKIQKRAIFAGADPRSHPACHDLRNLKKPVV
jgi:acyl-coenzyme A synthetase/AMP-(fatty) acid ligase